MMCCTAGNTFEGAEMRFRSLFTAACLCAVLLFGAGPLKGG